MKIRALLLFTVIYFLANSIKAQDIGYDSTIHSTKGYLLYFGDFLMLLETPNPDVDINFQKLSKIKGKLIRGSVPEIFVIGRDEGEKIRIEQYYKEEKSEKLYKVAHTYIIALVSIKYYKMDPLKMEDGYLHFSHNGKDHTIYYEDNWDRAITSVEIIR